MAERYVLFSPSAVPLPLGWRPIGTIFLAGGSGDIDVLVPGDPPLLCGACLAVGEETAVARGLTGGAAIAATSLATLTGWVEVARRGDDVGVDSLAGEGFSETSKLLVRGLIKESFHVVAVGTEAVGGVAGDAYFVFSSELEAGGLLRDVIEDEKAFVV